jgi:hypothetical protein
LHRLLRLEQAPSDESSALTKGGPDTAPPVLAQNAWAEARAASGDFAGYLDDLNVGWSVAAQEAAVCMELEYALMVATFNSQAAEIPDEVRGAAVRSGLWSPSQAITDAMAISDRWKRADALISLLPELSGAERSETLERVLGIARSGGPQPHSQLLRAVAPLAPAARGEDLLVEAAAAARAIGVPSHRTSELFAIATELSGSQRHELLAEAAAAAREVDNPGSRASSLAAIAIELGSDRRRDRLFTEALDALREEVSNRNAGAPILGIDVAKAVQAHRIDELRAVAPAMPPLARAQLLIRMCAALDDGDRSGVVEQALVAVRDVPAPERLVARVEIWPFTPDESAADLLAAVREQNPRWLPWMLKRLVPELTSEELRTEHRHVLDVDDPRVAADALSVLVPRFDGTERELAMTRLVDRILKLEFRSWQQECLRQLAFELPPWLLERALHHLRRIDDFADLLPPLARLARRLSDACVAELSALALELGAPGKSAETLALLACRIPQPRRQHVLDVALSSLPTPGAVGMDRHADIAVALAPCLPPNALAALAVELVEQLPSHWMSAQLALKLAPHLPDDLLRPIQHQILNTAAAASAAELVAIVRVLASTLDADTVSALVAHIQQVQDESLRLDGLAHLVGELESPHRDDVFDQALAAARVAGFEPERGDALLALARSARNAERARLAAQVIKAAESHGSQHSKASLLAGVADLLEGDERADVLNAALELAQASGVSLTLERVAAALPSDRRRALLRERLVLAIRSGPDQNTGDVHVLRTVADELAELAWDEIHPLLHEALRELAARPRVEVLYGLSRLEPALARHDVAATFDGLVSATQRVARWWP